MDPSLEIPIRLSGALRLIKIAETMMPKALATGKMPPEACATIMNQLAPLSALINQQHVHSEDEFAKIHHQMELVIKLVGMHSESLSREELREAKDAITVYRGDLSAFDSDE